MTIAEIQQVTLELRNKSGDDGLGFRAKNGKLQLVRVMKSAGAWKEEPLSEFLPHDEAIRFARDTI